MGSPAWNEDCAPLPSRKVNTATNAERMMHTCMFLHSVPRVLIGRARTLIMLGRCFALFLVGKAEASALPGVWAAAAC